MIRTFIALDLSPEIKTNLAVLARQLKSKGGFPVKWTAVENIHITLKFLGDVEEKMLPVLQSRLSATVQNFQPFVIRIGELGAFPKIDQPRTIWAGCEMDQEGYNVQKAVEKTTTDLGFPKADRPFSPHLTIGRVINSAGPRDYPMLAQIIRETAVTNLGTQIVNNIRVYRSDLLQAGPKYRILYDIPLG